MGFFRIGKKTAQTSQGNRIYAIGDVHGCFDLLADLFRRIERDNKSRDSAAKTKIIILGDFIDRGPRSAEVCQLLYSLKDYDGVVCLKGNHEEAMLESLAGDLRALRFWMEFGGIATLQSWGVDEKLIKSAPLSESHQHALIAALRRIVPAEMVSWLRDLPISYRDGDYFFVHAGIRPGVSLDAQKMEDLLWIREPFLSSWRRHEAIIVHGHSETDLVSFNGNRIGIDTAAYRTGCLTALGLDAEQQWTIETGLRMPERDPLPIGAPAKHILSQ